jgi:hypothetical protein
MRSRALPLLADHAIRVLDCSLSLDPDDEEQPDAYLMRAFDSLESRAAQEHAFYDGDAWREGPREAVLAEIESFHTVVLDVPDELARALADARPAG